MWVFWIVESSGALPILQRHGLLTGESCADVVANHDGKVAARSPRQIHEHNACMVTLRAEEREAAVTAGDAVVPVGLSCRIVRPCICDLPRALCVGLKCLRAGQRGSERTADWDRHIILGVLA